MPVSHKVEDHSYEVLRFSDNKVSSERNFAQSILNSVRRLTRSVRQSINKAYNRGFSEAYSKGCREAYSRGCSEAYNRGCSEAYSRGCKCREAYYEVGDEVYSKLCKCLEGCSEDCKSQEVDSKVYTEIGTEVDTEVGTEVGSEVSSEVSSKVDTEVNSKVNTEACKCNKVYSKVYSQGCSQGCHKLYSKAYNEVYSKAYKYSEVYTEACNRGCTQAYNKVFNKVFNTPSPPHLSDRESDASHASSETYVLTFSTKQKSFATIFVVVMIFFIILVAALFTSPRLAGATVTTPPTTRLESTTTFPLPDVDKFKLEIPLTRVSHPSAHYHPKAFIQKGPIKGSGLGMYLANGTEVYIVTDDTPPSYEHLTGLKEPGWVNDGKNSKFSLISGMAVKHDGSELYISDTHNDAIRLYIVEYHKMIDLAAGHYDSEPGYQFYVPELLNPSQLELYDTSLFVVIDNAGGGQSILQINIYTGFTSKLPRIPMATPRLRIGGMTLREFRLYTCVGKEVWALDTILVDSSYHRASDSKSLELSPVWEKMVSPDGTGLIVSQHISECVGLETSPQYKLLYVVSRATSKKETDSIVVYNLSSDSPQIADTLYNSAVSRIKGLGVRATGSRAIFLSSTSLYAAKFNHEEDPYRKVCAYCSQSPPGSAYFQYATTIIRSEWIYQTQMNCYKHPNQLQSSFTQNRQIEGQIKYFNCSDDKLFWDGDVTWYNFIPYICSIDSPLKERTRLWSCETFVCTLMTSGLAARPCLNGGTCTYQGWNATSGRKWLCTCPAEFTGPLCDTVVENILDENRDDFIDGSLNRKQLVQSIGGVLIAVVTIVFGFATYYFIKNYGNAKVAGGREIQLNQQRREQPSADPF